jgi:uncharacterized protein YkwD
MVGRLFWSKEDGKIRRIEMRRIRYPRTNRRRDTRLIIGWLFFVALGIGLLWWGFRLGKGDQQPERAVSEDRSSQMATETVAPPAPTPYIVAGADGVNVRNGPATSFEMLGYLDPGSQAELIGRDDQWWQIRYQGVEAWVHSPFVTAYNADDVGAPIPAPAPEVPAPAAGGSEWADEVFQRINQIRAENGLAPYTRNAALEQAALLHAQDSAQRGDLTHVGSDGSTVSTRVERAGYDAVGASEITVTGNSPESALNWWMDETPPNDPHRSAILSTKYMDIGVAVVEAGQTYYFIALLAQPQ